MIDLLIKVKATFNNLKVIFVCDIIRYYNLHKFIATGALYILDRSRSLIFMNDQLKR